MPTRKEDTSFADAMQPSIQTPKMKDSALDQAIDWISKNLNPDEVFPEKDLIEWAENNGYKKD